MSNDAGGKSALSDQLGLAPERKELDVFDWHEALDRASLFANLVDTELLQLAAVQRDDEARAKIELAASALAESYQILGRRRFPEGTSETTGPNDKYPTPASSVLKD